MPRDHQSIGRKGSNDGWRGAVFKRCGCHDPSSRASTCAIHTLWIPRTLTIPLLDFPLADTIRSLMGPRILLRNSNIRVTHPRTGDSTVWHTDFRPHISPRPRLTHAPAVVTLLIYLDKADATTGQLYVVPGSHDRPEQPGAIDADIPEQLALTIEPGQVVLMNAATWHRGGPNISRDRQRRLVTLQLSSVFMAPFNFETAQPGAAYRELLERASHDNNEPLLELLGEGSEKGIRWGGRPLTTVA